MIWLAMGIAFAGWCIGCGLEEVGKGLSEGFKLLAETEVK